MGAQVTAPGGDALYPTKFAPRGTILGAYPSYLQDLNDSYNPLVKQGGAYYSYSEGTSMAAPHVAGVVALIMSRHKADRRPTPRQIQKTLEATATPMACPPEEPRCKYAILTSVSHINHVLSQH